ncbi:MAG: hypothetical protein HC915_06495 [Anaerolineae bacterium]|nr:hypothetical protein [Anaerolineae bacterium]
MAHPDLALSRQVKPETWFSNLPEALQRYLATLQVPNQPGRLYPTAVGRTPAGEQIALGFRCYALKLQVMLGTWAQLPPQEQHAWIEGIQAYQVTGNPLHLPFGRAAFIDPPLVAGVAHQTRRLERWKHRWLHPHRLTRMQRMLSAETKQAIATLAEVGAESRVPYRAFRRPLGPCSATWMA